MRLRARVRLTRRRVLESLAGAAFIGIAAQRARGVRPLRVAATLDLSNVEKVNGAALHQGASACVRALNEAGGVNGAPVELVVADDRFDPAATRRNALAFQADGSILALLHPQGTRQTGALMEAVHDMAVVGPNTGAVALRRRDAANVFWVRANYASEVEKLVATARTLGIARIGMVHANDPFGQSLLDAFNGACAKLGVKPAVVATTPSTTSLEVDAAAERIAEAAPQVVVVGLAGTAPALVRALRRRGYVSTIYGISVGASAANIAAFADLARGLAFSIVVPSPYAAKHEIVRRYQADLRAAGIGDYSLPSLEGYINARVLVEGLRRAGANPTRESLLAALGRLSLDLGGMRIDFQNGRREGGSFVDLAVIGVNGRLLS
jgi:ABC-type branched-subunit amino acid transport system substrate-binding protein